MHKKETVSRTYMNMNTYFIWILKFIIHILEKI